MPGLGGRNRKCAEAFVKTGKPFDELEKEMLNGQSEICRISVPLCKTRWTDPLCRLSFAFADVQSCKASIPLKRSTPSSRRRERWTTTLFSRL